MVEKQCIGFLKTPPLWINEQFGIPQFDFPYTDLRGFAAKPISKKIRLGHQMEDVFHQLIQQGKDYEVLLYNLPIRQGKQTLGEIDFVLKEVVTNKFIHVELTYKFYIIDPEITTPIHRLIGPNKRDTFFTKMEKIKNKQFQLLHCQEGSNALMERNIAHDNISHEACFKAQLFTPYGMGAISIQPLNKECICGYWLRFDDFNSSEFKTYQYYIPAKSEWVVEPHTEVQWQDHIQVIMKINLQMRNENAPMVWMKKSDTEFEKFFVVWWK